MDSTTICDEFCKLLINCANNGFKPVDFFTFYNEFFNEKFGSFLDLNNESRASTNVNIPTISNDNTNFISTNTAETTDTATLEKNRIYDLLSGCFMKCLKNNYCVSHIMILLTDYMVELCFFNYNSSFVNRLLKIIMSLINEKDAIVIHFFTKSTKFFNNLSDKLVVEDFLVHDIPTIIFPAIMSFNFKEIHSKQIIISLSKFLQSVISIQPTTCVVTDQLVQTNIKILVNNVLLPINKLLAQKLSLLIQKKCDFTQIKETDVVVDKNHVGTNSNAFSAQNTLRKYSDPSIPVETPSITSPKFISTSPQNNANGTSVTNHSSNSGDINSNVPLAVDSDSASTVQKYYDFKLLRYYKNLWLNNRIHNWYSSEVDFFPKYQSIEATIVSETHHPIPSLDTAMVDFIETSFTCFAQFLNNIQYHQSNSNYDLLEKKWTIFISKRIPLIISQYCGTAKPYIPIRALQNIDDKVIKAIKTYYSTKDNEDPSQTNDDLFDDFNTNPKRDFDIRHEFLSNLIMLKLQPPNVMNEFLRDDQMMDLKSILIDENIFFKNHQNTMEKIWDVKKFVKTSIEEFDFENLFEGDSNFIANRSEFHGLLNVLQNFEKVAPTSQVVIAQTFLEMLTASVKTFDYKTLSKICCLLTLNFNHSLTTIFSHIQPYLFLLPLLNFVDKLWDEKVYEITSSTNNDTDIESVNDYIAFPFVLVFILHVSKEYNVDIEDIMVQNDVTDLNKSFILSFIRDLYYIPEDLTLPVTKEPYNSSKLLQDWTKSLFVDISISDDLIKTANVKDLAYLLPFMFKQCIETLESITNPKNMENIRQQLDPRMLSTLNERVMGGFEYFLQPFMMVGLIKIVFNLETILNSLKAKGLMEINLIFETILNMLTPLFNESSLLNYDSKALHNLIFRLNSPRLLLTLKLFRKQPSQPQSSLYGVYTAESQGNPKLEDLINKLEKLCDGAILYNINTIFTNQKQKHPHQQHSPNPQNQSPQTSPSISISGAHQVQFDFKITNECPVNKLMTNQTNSFWNLHSSTYYNMDYLLELIDLITPTNFFYDVYQTLLYKVRAYGIPTIGNVFKKSLSFRDDFNIVLIYFFYFTILLDFKDNTERLKTLHFLESPIFLAASDQDKREADKSIIDSSKSLPKEQINGSQIQHEDENEETNHVDDNTGGNVNDNGTNTNNDNNSSKDVKSDEVETKNMLPEVQSTEFADIDSKFDDDNDEINMLFGEDITSEQIDDVIMEDADINSRNDLDSTEKSIAKNNTVNKTPLPILDSDKDSATDEQSFFKVSYLNRNSFVGLLYRMKTRNSSPFENFEEIYDIYLQLLKKSIV
ncbi:uncharacterized protein SCODWIG_00636 [Saccharomycodes ludwigii]|uniref:Mediator of RNA polymerase II transcription subunit 5 n=1 Tax=Saccharomycodes ludwigii TaxID=36035 RepID=A0A376B2G5_9ASCO|nr:hypothetical protein SCDLUD_002721 [Saccharomycodes ludwigii]KAH3901234.1 hypothetical protein SCDLUD_002721 [Saccharomycodes ludwigii]SSD58875.1 uncharacterized protein SCODWIG_00636 [Saccharomycodes ludwigii]